MDNAINFVPCITAPTTDDMRRALISDARRDARDFINAGWRDMAHEARQAIDWIRMLNEAQVVDLFGRMQSAALLRDGEE